jgi:lipopolysaccharide export system permease protein
MDELSLIALMLFDSSLRRELWRGFVGTLVVLLTVVLTMMLIRLLGLATKGSVAVSDLSLLLGYTMISQTPTLLSLSLFVAVVGMINRLYRDSEMVVWQASGVRLMRMIRPLWQMCWPVLAALGLLLLVARPWAQQQSQLIKDRFERRSDIARVAPGQFQSSADGKRVFFIDSHSDGESRGKNVFIVLTDNATEAVVHASEGLIEIAQGQRYLRLWHGERVETRLDTGQSSRSRFETARVLIGQAPVDLTGNDLARNRPTWALMGSKSRDDQAELVWRLGNLWAAFNLVLIGLATTTSQTRRANAWTMVWALLVFVVYFNVLTLSQNWVASGRMSMGNGLFGIHGAVLAATLLGLWWRDGSWRRPVPVEGRA